MRDLALSITQLTRNSNHITKSNECIKKKSNIRTRQALATAKWTRRRGLRNVVRLCKREGERERKTTSSSRTRPSIHDDDDGGGSSDILSFF